MDPQSKVLEADYVGRLEMRVRARYPVGDTPWGGRRVDFLGGGTLRGPKIDAEVVDGVDVMVRRADATLAPDVKLVARCSDGALLYVSYRGILSGSREAMDGAWEGKSVPDAAFTIRTAVAFDTSHPAYAWLNQVIGVGYGERVAYPDGSRGIRFDIFAIR